MAAWFNWDGENLYLKGAIDRKVVPICARLSMVSDAAKQLGYPGGDRLYQLLRTRFYWKHMRLDCIRIASS